MKCLQCLREIKVGQFSCPYCRQRVQSGSYSIITEASDTPEHRSRRRLLQQVLQFSLVAITFIALASLVRLDPPKANPLPPENLRATAISAPTPAPSSEFLQPAEQPRSESLAPVLAPQATPVAEPQPISLLSVEDLRLARNGSSATTVLRVPDSLASAGADKPKRSRKVAVSADEVPPRKIATPIASSVPVVPKPAITPLTEAAPKLEVESAGVLLHPNTGLVTIKSYVPARVYIDGVYSGSTPRSVKLLAGEHTISLLADGYHDYSRKVKVSGQQQVGILASMSKK